MHGSAVRTIWPFGRHWLLTYRASGILKKEAGEEGKDHGRREERLSGTIWWMWTSSECLCCLKNRERESEWRECSDVINNFEKRRVQALGVSSDGYSKNVTLRSVLLPEKQRTESEKSDEEKKALTLLPSPAFARARSASLLSPAWKQREKQKHQHREHRPMMHSSN